jgi:hypothetical protein
MSISLDSKLVDTFTKFTVTRDTYGDKALGATTNIPCLYRDISTLDNANNSEQEVIDGIAWFRGDSGIVKGDVGMIGGEYFSVEKVNKAQRRLLTNATVFLKCELMRTRQVS